MFNGLSMHLGNLSLLSDAKTRSVSPENFTGEKGKGGQAREGTGANAARDLGMGWKVSPSVVVAAGETRVLADIEGEGAVQHIWMTPTGRWRSSILRIYWDGSETPSVECPAGDFFAYPMEPKGRGFFGVRSLAVCVNPRTGLNCYWEMPFRGRCRVTLENTDGKDMTLYYQIDYTLTRVPEDAAYFHAQFRRRNPLPRGEVYTILDGVRGKGHYVGTQMLWGVHSDGWWGEGEIKFRLDGDEHPTICGTGTEDYFCGSYNFDAGGYTDFSSPYAGMQMLSKPDGLYNSQQRFSLYRWHIMDPVRFESGLKVTIQALGWRGDGTYLPLQDDISSVAYWYQALPAAAFPKLPEGLDLEIV
ncbi:MAG: DUF2961 domain-containing protein [Firmicutes bacterium]|nr:DUF2961 domain-containing protein [Bacillota bacterium]